MKLPNGFGTVYKQHGNRHNPYVTKKTKGWELDEKTGKVKQLYNIVGYYPTRKEALTALAEFNANPYDVNAAKVTFEDIYERWSSEHFPTGSDSNIKGYIGAWLLCDKIAKMCFVDVKSDHLQMIVDESGKNSPMLRKLKAFLSLMYKYRLSPSAKSSHTSAYRYSLTDISSISAAAFILPFSPLGKTNSILS